MIRHPSAQKRLRQTLRITARRKPVRTATRNAMKAVRAAIAAGDKKAATAALSSCVERIDKAVQKGLWHRNAGSRYVSRLSAAVAAMK